MHEKGSSLRYLTGRVARHWRWTRTEGIARLIEEDQLHPVTRTHRAVRKWRWCRVHGVDRGEAVPVYLVGIQRSGTNMLLRGLETSPELEVRNENDRRVFYRYRLRSDETVAAVVRASRHPYVLFKPLCDSHRVDYLLDRLDSLAPGRAIWAYRAVDGRVRSAVAKFGDNNLRVLAEIAAGSGSDLWQAGRLSEDSLELIRSFDYSVMTPESAAALFWYVRNSLYFELGLHERGDVALSAYEALLADPESEMRRLCDFLDLPWGPRLIAHFRAHPSSAPPPLPLDPRIRARCDALQARLDAAAAGAGGARSRRSDVSPR